MVIIIFEVTPYLEYQQQYLDIAAKLKPLLEQQPGFISIERFQSLTNPEKVLSFSLWQDEESAQCWKHQLDHQKAQNMGRDKIFREYHIRVAELTREYSFSKEQE